MAARPIRKMLVYSVAQLDHGSSGQSGRFARNLVRDEAVLVAGRPQHRIEPAQFGRVAVLDEHGAARLPGFLGDATGDRQLRGWRGILDHVKRD